MFTNTKVERTTNALPHYLFFKKAGDKGQKTLNTNLKNFENLQNNIYINYINKSFSFPLITPSFVLGKLLDILVILFIVFFSTIHISKSANINLFILVWNSYYTDHYCQWVRKHLFWDNIQYKFTVIFL